MKRLLFHILGAGAGIWLAVKFIPGISLKILPDTSFFGISLTKEWQLYVLLAVILGLLYHVAKPILDILTLPLKIITLGVFSMIINLSLVWTVDLIFNELYIPLWLPLFYTSLLISTCNILLSLFAKKEENL